MGRAGGLAASIVRSLRARFGHPDGAPRRGVPRPAEGWIDAPYTAVAGSSRQR
jgi:hypothetical protein